MSESSLRGAVIGSGFGTHHLELLRDAGVAVEWLIYAHDRERAAAAARQWDVPRLTTDLGTALADGVDLLTVASPPATHLGAVLEAAPHVQWLACDKPLTVNGEEAARANRTVLAAGTNSMTFYQWRSHRGLRSLRDRIAGETNGSLRHLQVEFLHDFLSTPETEWAWRHDPLHAGAGAFADLGVHALDLICWLSGERPTVLTASSSVSWQERHAAGGVIPGMTEDVGSATLRLSSQADASLVVSRAATGRRHLRVVAVSAFGVDEVAVDPDDSRGAVDNPYAIWLRSRGDDDRTPSFEEGVRVQRLLDEILRQAGA